MLDYENLLKVLEWSSDEGRIHLISQLVEAKMQFLWTQPRGGVQSKIDPTQIPVIIEQIIDWFGKEEGELNRSRVSEGLRQKSVEFKVKFADMMKLMRSSLTGLNEGPSVGEIVEVLGRQTCIRRLKASLAFI